MNLISNFQFLSSLKLAKFLDKHKFKVPLLTVMFFLVLVSCSSEKEIPDNNQLKFEITNTTLKDIKIDYNNVYKNLSEHAVFNDVVMRSSSNPFLVVDTTNIQKIVAPNKDITFTFYVKNAANEDLAVKNLVIKQDANQNTKAYVINYSLTSNDLFNALNGKFFNYENPSVQMLNEGGPSDVVYVGSDGTCYGYDRILIAENTYIVAIVAMDCPEGWGNNGGGGSQGGGGGSQGGGGGSQGGGGNQGGGGSQGGGSQGGGSQGGGSQGGGGGGSQGGGGGGSQGGGGGSSPVVNTYPVNLIISASDCISITPIEPSISPSVDCSGALITKPLILRDFADIFRADLNPNQKQVWDSEENAAYIERLKILLETEDYNDLTREFVKEVLTTIFDNPIETYTQDSYPGKTDGWPFEWWLEEQEIIDRLPIPSDDLTMIPTPNRYEIVAFSIYPAQATLNSINAAISSLYSQSLENDTNGEWKFRNGHADAIRHSLWNALGANQFQKSVMVLFAWAHEMPNLSGREFEMDSFNNARGQEVGDAYEDVLTVSSMKTIIINEHQNGTLKYFSPLQENGTLLPNSILKWTNQ